jgi:creatinine amidohydrolase
MGNQTWRFDALGRDQLRELSKDATLVLPIGSTEQHAHHLPVRTDAAVVTAIAEACVERASASAPILLLPTLPFGFAHHHLPFGGTVSLRSETYVDVLTDIAVGLSEQGFKRLVFLNGHGGNDAAMRLVVDRLMYEKRIKTHVAAASYWLIAGQALTNIVGIKESHLPGHAGHFETSLMLALAPELVHLEARPHDSEAGQPLGEADIPLAHIRRPGVWEASDGRSDDAQLATAEMGRKVFEEMVTIITEFLLRFHHSGSTSTHH